MQDLINELTKARKLLNDCITAYKNTGRKLAGAEQRYRIALRQEILKLKISGADDGGGPVAWTVCGDLARGSDEVAKLRFERDISKSDHEVCYEKILQLKLELRIIENQMSAERRGL